MERKKVLARSTKTLEKLSNPVLKVQSRSMQTASTTGLTKNWHTFPADKSVRKKTAQRLKEGRALNPDRGTFKGRGEASSTNYTSKVGEKIKKGMSPTVARVRTASAMYGQKKGIISDEKQLRPSLKKETSVSGGPGLVPTKRKAVASKIKEARKTHGGRGLSALLKSAQKD